MCKNQKDFENEAQKFNNFLNKTIIGTSKEYYRKELEKRRRELKVLDNELVEENLEKYLQYSQSFFEIQSAKSAIDFINLCENLNLYLALKSLSAIEQTVIFLLYSEDFSSKEVSKILNLHISTVSKVKSRSLRKLRKNLKEGDLYE